MIADSLLCLVIAQSRSAVLVYSLQSLFGSLDLRIKSRKFVCQILEV